MSSRTETEDAMDSEKSFDEHDPLHEHNIDEHLPFRHRHDATTPWPRRVVAGLCLVVAIQAVALAVLAATRVRDPSLGLWSPANDVVRYVEVRHDGEDKSPYVTTEPPLIDKMWMDLYDFGTVGLSSAENAKLLEPTTPTPMDPNAYPVMISVFHNIHCLNLIRKAVWRDFYPEALDMLPDGRANRTSPKALHIDHCINGLRQSLMCSSDVTPITFHPVSDEDRHVFPNLAATRTCRDFGAIREWARGRQIEAWKMDINLTRIAAAADAAQGMM